MVETKTQIMNALRQAGRPLLNSELMAEFAIDTEKLDQAVTQLLAEGEVLLTRKKRLALPKQLGLKRGRLQANAKGFAFFIPDDGNEDWFIPGEALSGAMHGDLVWARVVNGLSRSGSTEAEVVGIIERANKRLVGTFEKNGRKAFVLPDETRIPTEIEIPRAGIKKAKPGQKVVVQIQEYSDGFNPITGNIIEVLGEKGEAGVDILSIIRQYDLYEEFPRMVLKQSDDIVQDVDPEEASAREDLRNETIVTIDGADSRDFDDAVSLKILENGNYLLGVHIADVSHYIKQKSPLDKEAYKRGTSVYFVDRVLPMLPHTLSNGICSLNPGVDRLTFSCFMEIGPSGEVVAHRLSETVIRSAYRLVYEDVTSLLTGNKELKNQYAPIVEMLTNMEKLCGILLKRRINRGSIDFDLDEASIALGLDGKPTDVGVRERGIANRIIEEFMLCCNETIAKHAFDLEKPFLYRVHEVPDKDKMLELNTFLQTLGYSIKDARQVHPKTLQLLLDSVKGKPEEHVVNRVTLRSLKKARYCEKNLGHFGLAAENYCHFTSPIRRYPDLMIHRILKELIHGKLNKKRIFELTEMMPDVAAKCSERERLAMEAERAVDDLKKCEFMQDKIGSRYTGRISGVTSFGFFVELENTIEGLVRMTSLDDDYYVFDERNYKLVGRSTGRQYRLGDEIRITVIGVEMSTRKIEFAPIRLSSAGRPWRTKKPGKEVPLKPDVRKPTKAGLATRKHKRKPKRRPGSTRREWI